MTTGTVVLIRLHKKADLIDMKVNCRKNGKAHVDKNSFDLGKNVCHKPSSLGSRSIVVIRQADESLAVHIFVKV